MQPEKDGFQYFEVYVIFCEKNKIKRRIYCALRLRKFEIN